MKNAGIICEYNPFHNAHAYHIAKTRSELGENCGIVCAMSGNFVQRGEPAVFSKHVRAQAAVKNGADLVIELPVLWAAQTAERFAFGGVSLLNNLGVITHLSFGSESGNVEELKQVADMLSSDEIDLLIKKELKKGISYAAARQTALEKLMPDLSNLLREPNNILSIEYLKALDKLGSDIEAMTTRRYMAAHDSPELFDGFASASKLREMIKSGDDVRQFVPQTIHELLLGEIERGCAPIFPENMEQAALYRLKTMTEQEFERLPDSSEGLYMRFMRFARSEAAVKDVLEKTKSKRYTMARIRRMLLSAYLGIERDDMISEPPYIRVLAFNSKGRAILREISKKSPLPIIVKPADAKKLDDSARAVFEKEVRATDLYRLLSPNAENRGGGQEWKVSPVKV